METPRINIPFALVLFVSLVIFPAYTGLLTEPPSSNDTTEVPPYLAHQSHGIADDVELPKVIGGLSAIQDKVTYPLSAQRAGIAGRVVVEFAVNRDGAPVGVRITQGIGGGCDEAARDAVRQVRFEPGTKNGSVVPVALKLNVDFNTSTSETASVTASPMTMAPPPPPMK